MLLCLILLLSSAWAQDLQPREPVVIDRVAIVVGPRIITDSDLRLSIALDAADPSPVEVVRDQAIDPLEWLINQHILHLLAGKTRVYQPTESEVRARLNRLKAASTALEDHRRFLQVHGLDEARLFRQLERRMVVENYIRRNLVGQDKAPPTAAEFRKWMSQHREPVRIRIVPPTADLP
jgi:hypothetical protein